MSAERLVPREVVRSAASSPGLKLLVLYGLRARGDARSDSDWDFAYAADPGFDADGFLAMLAERSHANRIDLADLERTGALHRHHVARDGVVLFEREPGRFERFRLQAIQNWCDLAPVLMPLYEGALEALPQ